MGHGVLVARPETRAGIALLSFGDPAALRLLDDLWRKQPRPANKT